MAVLGHRSANMAIDRDAKHLSSFPLSALGCLPCGWTTLSDYVLRLGSKSLLVKSMRWRAVRQGCGPLSGPVQAFERCRLASRLADAMEGDGTMFSGSNRITRPICCQSPRVANFTANRPGTGNEVKVHRRPSPPTERVIQSD